MSDEFDDEDLHALTQHAPPAAAARPKTARGAVRWDERTEEHQCYLEAFAHGCVAEDRFFPGYEAERGGWVIGRCWWDCDGESYFISLRRTPVFRDLGDAMVWLKGHPSGE